MFGHVRTVFPAPSNGCKSGPAASCEEDQIVEFQQSGTQVELLPNWQWSWNCKEQKGWQCLK